MKDRTRRGWTTPSESFAPFYSYALADVVVGDFAASRAAAGGDSGLRVVEVGGGRGTNAVHFLNRVRDRWPEVYGRCSYRIVEISPGLAEIQRAALAAAGHAAASVEVADFLSPPDSGPAEPEGAYVLLLEVLDNLPHDRVVVSKSSVHGEVELETWVEEHIEPVSGKAVLEEALTSLQDPLIVDTLAAFAPWGPEDGDEVRALAAARDTPLGERLRMFARNLGAWAHPNERVTWVPTGSLAMLEHLASRFPAHRLIAADFDHLPTMVAGDGAPIVQTHNPETGLTTVFATYRIPVTGLCDIFFPTDFSALQRAYARVVRAPSKVLGQPVFLKDHAVATKSGWSPMTGDYKNMSVFLGGFRDK